MPACRESAFHVLETEFADPQPPIGHDGVLLRVRGGVPCVDVEGPESDALDFLEPDGSDGRSSCKRGRCTRVGELRREEAVSEGPVGKVGDAARGNVRE